MALEVSLKHEKNRWQDKYINGKVEKWLKQTKNKQTKLIVKKKTDYDRKKTMSDWKWKENKEWLKKDR